MSTNPGKPPPCPFCDGPRRWGWVNEIGAWQSGGQPVRRVGMDPTCDSPTCPGPAS